MMRTVSFVFWLVLNSSSAGLEEPHSGSNTKTASSLLQIFSKMRKVLRGGLDFFHGS